MPAAARGTSLGKMMEDRVVTVRSPLCKGWISNSDIGIKEMSVIWTDLLGRKIIEVADIHRNVLTDTS